MAKSEKEFYDERFFSALNEGMSKSAMAVLGILYKHYVPKSVIDIGCGQGAWLAVAEALGTQVLKGFDGDWINESALISKQVDFSPANFEESMPVLETKYDLCMSVEVAEHITKARAKPFVDLLCSASDIVLFGAAIRHQGGTNHVNEQWQSYWVSLFRKNGYECLDLFRPKLWSNKAVEWWYRQNTFLFVKPDSSVLNVQDLKNQVEPIFDAVHPVNYEIKIQFLINELKNREKHKS